MTNFKKNILQAQELLRLVKGAPLEKEERIAKAVELAGYILKAAQKMETFQEKKITKELAAVVEDPQGKSWMMRLTDRCFRSRQPKRVIRQLLQLKTDLGFPRFIPFGQRCLLKGFMLLARFLPKIASRWLKQWMYRELRRVVIPGEKGPLERYLKSKHQQHIQVNLNRLGEAILGEEEAEQRLQLYLADLRDPAIRSISVKISSLYSQIRLEAWLVSLEQCKKRLRLLYREAQHHSSDEQGSKKVHLDMEEYRDLELTVTAFKEVLDEPEFFHFSAGIALQSYIPDSFLYQQELTLWAKQRTAAGGAPIRVRIVKGANLAMEKLESRLKGWPQAPYLDKLEADAQFKKMVLYAAQPDHAPSVHVGIGSHNLFDIAYAALIRSENRVESYISFEMLEGMANALSRAVHAVTGSMLIYTPVAKKEEFLYAMAYLMRRLDENTAPQNFLHDLFAFQTSSASWEKQVEAFKKACREESRLFCNSQRIQNRLRNVSLPSEEGPFLNEPDTDWSIRYNRRWLQQELEKGKQNKEIHIPLVIGGKELYLSSEQQMLLIDPGDASLKWGTFSLAGPQEVEEVLKQSKASPTAFAWSLSQPSERSSLLAKAAQIFRKKRGELIFAMMANTAKGAAEADQEVSEAIDFIEYYRRNFAEWETYPDVKMTAKGVVVVASPWNFPCSIPTGGIAAALITGNRVIFKPSLESVWVGWRVAQCFWEAGVSREVLQFFVCEDEPMGSQLLEDERIGAVILTGGTDTAKKMLKMARGWDLIAETGGKNAMIITAMADRDLAIRDLVASAFGHAGQKCSACSLAILEEEVYHDPQFRQQLKDAVQSLAVGSQWELQTRVNPLIRPPGRTLWRGLTTLEEGEEWLVRPEWRNREKTLWSPGVKWGVRAGSFTHQMELFGPVLGVMKAKDLQEAIQLTNGTLYGLTAGLHTLDEKEKKEWLQKIEAGNCYINRTMTGAIVGRQPFGGCKASSFGRGAKAGGVNYLTQLVHLKQVAYPSSDWEKLFDKLPFFSSVEENLVSSPDLLLQWTTSLKSYQEAWESHFSQKHDPQLIPGEENFFYYIPQSLTVLRLQLGDAMMDYMRVIAAAVVCKAPLLVSLESFQDFAVPLKEWMAEIPQLQFQEEREVDFLAASDDKKRKRIRFVSSPFQKLERALNDKGCCLLKNPVLMQGRLELLNYVREVLVSHAYHRYGNLDGYTKIEF